MNVIRITPTVIEVDSRPLPLKERGGKLLVEAYRALGGDYPKFFKMDTLCRLGFVASELLLRASGDTRQGCADRAVVIVSRSASLQADTQFQATIQDPENFYPSPACFVYTLPNIVTGEIAIRNKYYGETMSYVLAERDPRLIAELLRNTLAAPFTHDVIGGWMECGGPDKFEAALVIANENELAAALPENIFS